MKNWLLILKQYKHPVSRIEDVPVRYKDVVDKFNGTLFVTTRENVLPDDCNTNLVRGTERTPIMSVGKFCNCNC
jgi:hypothetical protein